MTDVAHRIHEWLTKTGYPLEMQAASTLAQAGFSTRQATMFTDPSSMKSRDIDVHAFKSNLFGDISLSLVLECKRSDKPWVVLTSPETLRDFNRLFALGLSTEGLRGEFIQVGPKHQCLTHLIQEDRCGYAIKQAMSGDNDPAYTACSGVIAAARATLISGTRFTSEPYHLVLPVVVIDTPLFEAELDLSGQVRLTPVEQSKVLFGWDGEGPGPTCIHVVPIHSLLSFARMQLSLAEDLIAQVECNPPEQRLRGPIK